MDRTARARLSAVVVVLVTALSAATVSAHVAVKSPSDGATFQPGETMTIQWEETIAHETQNWDIHFMPSSDTKELIAENLDVSRRSYEWTVPETSCNPTCYMQVTQDNSGRNYVGAGSFQIATGDTGVGTGDATSDASGDTTTPPDSGSDRDTGTAPDSGEEQPPDSGTLEGGDTDHSGSPDVSSGAASDASSNGGSGASSSGSGNAGEGGCTVAGDARPRPLSALILLAVGVAGFRRRGDD